MSTTNSQIRIDTKAALGRRDGGFLTGKLLVAMPSLQEERYRHKVLVIYEHNPDGAKGFILNQLNEKVNFVELTRQLNIICKNPPEPPMYSGGPIENMRGFVLHSADRSYRTSMKIAPNLLLTSNIDPLNEIANRIGPRERMVLLGHNVWGAGELEREITDNHWLVMECESSIIFMPNVEGKWSAAMQKMGINPGALSLVVGEG